tara:strand:- start:3255 stop:4061 length:807 start_codon:yes stop_codon:yes gene_type:complete
VDKNLILHVHDLLIQRGAKNIVNGLNWKVDHGEHWVVLGPNGCGKTSLLASLAGYLFPTSGNIHVLGSTFGEDDWTNLRKHIGLVSSTLNKYMAEDEPLLETIVSGKYAMIDLWHEPSNNDKKLALAMLKRIECLHLKNQPWAQLSQGERQRALIGRALMANPKLLILDEPCAGLDPIAREHFLQFIERLATQNMSPTIVLITHHTEEIMPMFTHALLIRNGKDIAQGKVKTVLNDANLSLAFNCPVQIRRRQGRYRLDAKPKKNSVM